MLSRRKSLLDILASHDGSKTREEHLAAILCGEVYAGGEKIRDPKRLLPCDTEILIKPRAFVSRGGEKLDHALTVWAVEAEGKTVLDAGASTGGFTDCLLRRGAARVYAVDVGRGQLHPGLKQDPRVIAREKTNIMSLASLDPAPAFAVCDLSFRSLRGAAPHIAALTREGRLIALVKPQFEWQNPGTDFHGVVRGADSLRRILLGLLGALEAEGLTAHDIIASPLKGRAGNREFFFDLRTTSDSRQTPEPGLQRLLQEKIELLTR